MVWVNIHAAIFSFKLLEHPMNDAQVDSFLSYLRNLIVKMEKKM